MKKYCQTEQVDSLCIGNLSKKMVAPSEVEVKYSYLLKNSKTLPRQSIERYDERYTSKMAFQSMIDGRFKKRKTADKGMIDQSKCNTYFTILFSIIKKKTMILPIVAYGLHVLKKKR